MDYGKVFNAAIDRLHEEGRYRVFIDILRNKGAFPNARCFAGHNGPKPITVWCSNDYLAMGQHPKVIAAMEEALHDVGAGSGGTRNIGGNTHYHVDLEAELADLHAKESALLFPALRQRCPELRGTLDRLDADHGHGETAIRALAHALLAWEVLGQPRQQPFIDALDRYIDGYISHMAAEEQEVLPAARRHLTESDWAALDAAFAANRDPLTGHPAEAAFQPLFQKILRSAPAPIGLG